MNNTNKVIVNTGVSYLALGLNMVFGLISVRLILQALGEESYGIYVIVGGIVAMLDILNSNMSNTSMRYLAYSLGSKDKNDILVTFNSTVVIHYLIGLLTIAILEVGGWIMFEYIVNIPEGRMGEAKIIYQFMVVTTFITVISVPYDAVTNAHEKIWMLSVFDVMASVLKLGVAIALIYYGGNRLIFYGFLLMALQVLMRIVKVTYARRNFSECRKRMRNMVNKNKIKEILSFTGWNLFGSIAALGAGQLRSIIVNYFFGVRLNAAQGVSSQVSHPLNQIVVSMTRAINPQIMKSEGGGDHQRMKYIVAIGAKYSTFLMALFGIPVLIEAPFLLGVWLDKVPEYAVIFVQFSIVGMLMEKLTFQLNHAVSAVGNIRGLQFFSAVTNLLYLPVAWYLFNLGYSPVSIYWLFLVSLVLIAIVSLYFAKRNAGIEPLGYAKSAIIPVVVPMFLATFMALALKRFIATGWTNLIVVVLFYCVCFVALFWALGMDKAEHKRWKGIIKQVTTKKSKI